MKATVILDLEDELISKIEERLMPKFDELNARIDRVGATLGNEHSEVASAVAALNTTIAELRAQLDDMLTPDQFATLVAKLDALDDQAARIYDAPVTPTEPLPDINPNQPTEPDVNPDEPPPAPEMPEEGV